MHGKLVLLILFCRRKGAYLNQHLARYRLLASDLEETLYTLHWLVVSRITCFSLEILNMQYQPESPFSVLFTTV